MSRRGIILVLLGLALLTTVGVAVWAFSLGASPLVAMPPMAQLTALMGVLLGLDRRATIIVIAVALAVAVLLVVLGALTIGPFLVPAVVLDVIAIVLVSTARTRTPA